MGLGRLNPGCGCCVNCSEAGCLASENYASLEVEVLGNYGACASTLNPSTTFAIDDLFTNEVLGLRLRAASVYESGSPSPVIGCATAEEYMRVFKNRFDCSIVRYGVPYQKTWELQVYLQSKLTQPVSADNRIYISAYLRVFYVGSPLPQGIFIFQKELFVDDCSTLLTPFDLDIVSMTNGGVSLVTEDPYDIDGIRCNFNL